MDLSIYVTRFEELVKLYGDGSDEFNREDVNEELHKRWPFYAYAGVDMMQLAEMMSVNDAWRYYSNLIEFGAKMTVDRFVKEFSPYLIRKNWTLLLERGASEEELEAACRLNRKNA